jgi:hypothetical protein
MFLRLLLGLIGMSLAVGARSEELEVVPERSVDITGTFLNLDFTGVIETAERGDDCVYKIPSLTIHFARRAGLATMAINLDQFRIVVAAPNKKRLLLQRYPLPAALTSSNSEVRVPAIEFTVPKQMMHEAEYVAVAVGGQPVFDFDSLPLPLGPEDKDRLLHSHALWPIGAHANIASQTVDQNGERGQTVYRTPRDPNDDCSSVKIR